MRKLNLKLLLSFLITLGAIVAMIVAMEYTLPASKSPAAVQGKLDLTGWSFERDGIALLNGEWQFYSGKLLTPEELTPLSAAPGLARVPGTRWLEKMNGQPRKGNATYRLTVLLPSSEEKLAIKVQNIWMSHRLYINGVLVKEMGVPSEDAAGNESANHD
ncbi:hypothetical protein H8B09_17975 [Paenibacillus sp. PR3]|uniref:DUF4830 domain-containing protein n=1 Tax=Paenibacillus terricola TaxID=2763503 RepID=A0ABR8MXP0_9BACL|nr:hypothetical protein [Paenibacillus terricola]MBD3920658.1 hypothetical protein [Paenibacillus terricola]